MQKVIILLSLLIICCFQQTIAQNQKQSFEIEVISIIDSNDVSLRWTTNNYDSWKWCSDSGYVLTRYTLIDNGTALSDSLINDSKIVLDSLILPKPEAYFDSLSNTKEVAGVAMGAIYGDTFNVVFNSGDITTAYSNSVENSNRFGIALFAAEQDFEIAMDMGLAYTDTTVSSNSEYRYIIAPAGNTDSINFREGWTIINTNDSLELDKIKEVKYESMEGRVVISWKIPLYDNDYSSYTVERSEDNGNTYSKRNQYPITYSPNTSLDNYRCTYLDSLESPDKTYIYRVRGKSSFGIMGPPSDAIHVIKAEQPLNISPSIDQLTETQGGAINIKWEYPSSLDTVIQGFNIYRSESIDGNYIKLNDSIITNTQRNFLDLTPNPSNYYRVEVIDRNGFKRNSFESLVQAADSIAPAAPTNLGATVNESGLLTLSWSNNTEDDLLGYRVYESNHLDGRYMQVTEKWVKDTSFLLQLDMSSMKNYTYLKVAALDHRQNTSFMSNALEVEIPDVHPPAKPAINIYQSGTDSISFSVVQSASDDVDHHVIQRRNVKTPEWEDLKIIPKTETLVFFSDDSADPQFTYQYRILAYDEKGNVSSSKIIGGSPLDSGEREPIENTNVEKNNQMIRLYWSYPDINGIVKFQIYRNKDDGGYRAYRAVPIEEGPTSGIISDNNSEPNLMNYQYEDTDVTTGSQYKYKIMAELVGGGYSPMTDEIVVDF